MAAGSVATKALDKGVTSSAAQYSSAFDSSGWNVNIGGGSPVQTSENTKAPAVAAAAGLLKNPLVLILIGAAIYLAMKK
jgi:hypothetical protein